MAHPTTTEALPQVTHSQRHYTGRIISVRVDTLTPPTPDAPAPSREVVEHPGGVCVLPQLPDGRYLLVRQYRHPLGEWLLEFPAGKLDVAGEAPLVAVQRELWEETGYTAQTWEPLTVMVTAPGFCDEKIHLFKATGLALDPTYTPPDPNEDTRPVAMHAHELLHAARTGQLVDGKSLALLAWLTP